jgi:hypothetical protein
MPSPFHDHAAPILAGDPVLSDEHRAALWDVFHSSKDPNDLAQKLQPMTEVPDDTKHQLYLAKQQAQAGADPVTAALGKMEQMNPATLDLAEQHPTVLKTLVAALAPSESKGSGDDDKKKKIQLPPRIDGLEHYPEIPEGHFRVMASDGGLHDIPQENIQSAMAHDPRLHVLNP